MGRYIWVGRYVKWSEMHVYARPCFSHRTCLWIVYYLYSMLWSPGAKLRLPSLSTLFKFLFKMFRILLWKSSWGRVTPQEFYLFFFKNTSRNFTFESPKSFFSSGHTHSTSEWRKSDRFFIQIKLDLIGILRMVRECRWRIFDILANYWDTIMEIFPARSLAKVTN